MKILATVVNSYIASYIAIGQNNLTSVNIIANSISGDL